MKLPIARNSGFLSRVESVTRKPYSIVIDVALILPLLEK